MPRPRAPRLSSPAATRWLSIAALALLYFLAAKAALIFAFVRGNVSAVWPASGLALAVLMRGSRRLWPGVLIGATLGTLSTGAPLGVACLIGVGNTLEAVLGATLLRQARVSTSLERVQDVWALTTYAALGCSTVAATLGTFSLCLGGLAPWGAFGAIWPVWWLGDAVGILVVTPVILTWLAKEPAPEHPVETVLVLCALMACWELVFGDWLPSDLRYPYFTFPLLIWLALRSSPRVTATAVALASALAIWHTAHDSGPFARLEVTRGLVLLQSFAAVISFTTITLAAAVLSSRRDQLRHEAMIQNLARSNAELERFAYVASHDLQEPLRQVTSFTQLLQQRYGERLDGEATEYMRFAVNGAKRMYALINDLLAYSRIDRVEELSAPCELREAVNGALANLRRLIEESGAELDVGALPQIGLPHTQMVALFQNLVGNALKYRAEGRKPRVTLRCKREGALWHFRVEDNGIGIAPEYLEQIFIIFKRLHGPDQYPGTGVGLAICKRIVEQYGGRIWAESEPGRGSCFHFVLPVESPVPGAMIPPRASSAGAASRTSA